MIQLYYTAFRCSSALTAQEQHKLSATTTTMGNFHSFYRVNNRTSDRFSELSLQNESV